MRVREATDDDLPVLRAMLLEANNWTGEERFTPARLLADPHAGRYLAGWRRPGDLGFVASDPSSPDAPALGSIWARPLPAAAPGYGYVADDVPELSMAVAAHARGRGVGTALLSTCVDAGRARGWRAVSLSVEDGNEAARHLYVRHGFVTVGRNGGADTMLLEL
ncbi:GNAT family N-acetyltransferase [Cellulomonas marina]|uniref:Ribosomal protein S18 acetylase RimI n=1 Tax=Cellulomonas marina TaxID=988821 RepID=A0A1I1A3M0_9CELL|nr:N-acetyltransferase [Cellulomonas marina]GIG30277.1 hypothetical protein Cma02nite_28770 [Cellulomonas marina]SFB31188.1 Ribosomal protein S18 acetylase RimI [Cellulomonas marina]